MDRLFTRLSGNTPSDSTGPLGAAVGSYYVYAETSGSGNYGKSFDLDRSFPAGQELYGVTFQYHMYGATMGSAILESSADGTSWVSLWSKSGNMGNQWRQATSVYLETDHNRLRFTFTSGSDYYSDFALDDIRVGDCLTVGCSALPNLPCIQPGGSCDPATGRCALKADGAACDDGNAQTTNGICDSGLCRACPVPTDDCEIAAGNYDQGSQQCSPTTTKVDGTPCDDASTQTINDVCVSGLCQGCSMVTNECDSGIWDFPSSQCVPTPDGTACDAGGTVAHGSCASSVCRGAWAIEH